MKRLKNNRGSLLIESLVSLSIMSLVIITMVFSLTQMFEAMSVMKSEVEGWRYFQDAVNSKSQGGSVTSRTSDGNVMTWQESPLSQTVTIKNGSGIEVLYVEIYQ